MSMASLDPELLRLGTVAYPKLLMDGFHHPSPKPVAGMSNKPALK